MKDYYAILGIPKNSSKEDIKKAYQRLAMKYHPDRVPESEKVVAEAKFKEIKAAYEALTSEPASAADHWQFHGNMSNLSGMGLDDIMELMRRAHATRARIVETQLEITLPEALSGCDKEVHVSGTSVTVTIPPGVPDGFRYPVRVNNSLTVVFVIRMSAPGFVMPDPTQCNVRIERVRGSTCHVIECGDVEKTVQVDALDLFSGIWLTVKGLEGEDLQVRIPAGFNPEHRLKVKEKGYYHWVHELSCAHPTRADLYVRVRPVFVPADKLDKTKLQALLNEIGKDAV
jgi:curved DNA-binding protein